MDQLYGPRGRIDPDFCKKLGEFDKKIEKAIADAKVDKYEIDNECGTLHIGGREVTMKPGIYTPAELARAVSEASGLNFTWDEKKRKFTCTVPELKITLTEVNP